MTLHARTEAEAQLYVDLQDAVRTKTSWDTSEICIIEAKRGHATEPVTYTFAIHDEGPKTTVFGSDHPSPCIAAEQFAAYAEAKARSVPANVDVYVREVREQCLNDLKVAILCLREVAKFGVKTDDSRLLAKAKAVQASLLKAPSPAPHADRFVMSWGDALDTKAAIAPGKRVDQVFPPRWKGRLVLHEPGSHWFVIVPGAGRRFLLHLFTDAQDRLVGHRALTGDEASRQYAWLLRPRGAVIDFG